MKPKEIVKQTILVVDDEDAVIRTITKILMLDGHKVLSSLSGEEGLSLLAQNNIDLVISDLKMPGMNGLEFLQKVRIDYPHILTILLTGHGNLETALQAINEAGVYKFILKPWDINDLRITVKRALELRELTLERDSLQREVVRQEIVLRDLERENPGIFKIERNEAGEIIFDL